MDEEEPFRLPSESDPVLGRGGSPLGYLTLGLRALNPSNLSAFYSDQVSPALQSGLGLSDHPQTPEEYRDRVNAINDSIGGAIRTVGGGLGRGIDAGLDAASSGLSGLRSGLEAITPSQDTLYKIAQGLEAGAATGQGRTPLYLQQQQQDFQRQQLLSQAEERKQMMALRIQEQQEQKRQHDMGMLEKVFAGTHPPGVKAQMLDQLGNDQNFLMAPQARQLGKALKDADYDSFNAYQQFIPQDVQQQFIAGKLPQAELSAWVDHARESAKVDAKESAKSRIVADAMNTPPEKRTPYMNQLVEEREAAAALKRSTIDLQQSQIAKNLADGGQDKVTQTMNGLSRGFFGVDARALTPDMMVTPEDRERIRQHGLPPLPAGPVSRLTALSRYANVDVPTLMAGNRAVAGQTAQLTVPDKPSPTERQNLVDDVGTLSRLDSLRSLYNEKYVGPIRGRIGAATEMFGGITEDEADFRAEVSTLKNQVIKQITGAQMSEPEAKRIMKQIPDAENPPVVFESRLKRTRENVLMMAKKRRQILKDSGIDVSHLAPLPEQYKVPPRLQNALDEVLGK